MLDGGEAVEIVWGELCWEESVKIAWGDLRWEGPRQHGFCTQNLVHTDAFTHRRFYTNRQLYGAQNFYIIHRESSFYAAKLVHTGQRGAFLHRNFYIGLFLIHSAEAFTHRNLYTQKLYTLKLLHTETFTHRSFYTSLYTMELLHTDRFTQRSLYARRRLDRKAFTHRSVYTE